jgi:hypothetical protein
LIGHAALSDGEANIDEPNDNNHSRSIRSHNNPRDRSLNGRSDEQKRKYCLDICSHPMALLCTYILLTYTLIIY